MTLVKVCGLTRPQDVEHCLELGVDRVGFVLAPSRRRLELDQLDKLLPLLPHGYPWVAVLVDAPDSLIEALIERACPILQVHGQESPEQLQRWSGRAHRVKALALRQAHDLDLAASYDVEELLLDSPQPGHGQAFDWTWLDKCRPPRPFFLAGGLHSDNVAEALVRVRPQGVDVSSGVESAPGHKDAIKLKAFLQRVRKPSA